MKRDFNAWRDSLGDNAPLRSLTELRQWNTENALLGPFGMSFAGLACSEPRLIALAYAFERATQRRISPPATP